MTNEELDKARVDEALRILRRNGGFPGYVEISLCAARLAREGWQPTPAVDPLGEALAALQPVRGESFREHAARLTQALASRGLEIVEIAREDKSKEAERRGIERVREWCHRNGVFECESIFDAKFCRDLMGEN